MNPEHIIHDCKLSEVVEDPPLAVALIRALLKTEYQGLDFSILIRKGGHKLGVVDLYVFDICAGPYGKEFVPVGSVVTNPDWDLYEFFKLLKHHPINATLALMTP